MIGSENGACAEAPLQKIYEGAAVVATDGPIHLARRNTKGQSSIYPLVLPDCFDTSHQIDQLMKFTSAKDLMTTDVKSVDAEWPVNRVAQFLIDHEISGAPVVKDGALIGVVSLTDLARHNSASGETSRRPASFYRAELEAEYAEEEIDQLRVSDSAGTTAEHVMTPQVYDVSPHTSIKQVAQVMHRGGIHRLFVTESGKIQGVISALDMLKVIAEE